MFHINTLHCVGLESAQTRTPSNSYIYNHFDRFGSVQYGIQVYVLLESKLHSAYASAYALNCIVHMLNTASAYVASAYVTYCISVVHILHTAYCILHIGSA
jgi:hypothetical protein